LLLAGADDEEIRKQGMVSPIFNSPQAMKPVLFSTALSL
jgi:hypothetical protein